MDRRSLLLGAAVAAITIPGWNHVFAQKGPSADKRGRLERAIDAARTRGRPLIVIPGSPSKTALARIAATWSLYLREGTDRALAELALCEIVCASLDEIRASFPAVEGEIGRDFQALLVECRDRSARWIRAELPELPTDPLGRNEAQYDAIVTQRNALLEAALHEALAWDFEMLYRRDEEQRAMLTRAQKAQLEGKLSWDTVPTRMHAELVPAFVLRQARGIAGRAHVRMLADVAIERWVHGSFVGMTWDKSFGCAGGPCGTGYVNPSSRRFLTYYADHR